MWSLSTVVFCWRPTAGITTGLWAIETLDEFAIQVQSGELESLIAEPWDATADPADSSMFFVLSTNGARGFTCGVVWLSSLQTLPADTADMADCSLWLVPLCDRVWRAMHLACYGVAFPARVYLLRCSTPLP